MTSVTVVIPTRNRPAQVARCLDALSRVDFPRDAMEICIVDDGGDGSLDGVVANYASRLPVRVVPVPHGGPARARNAGAEQAHGDVLAFLDDDCAPAVGWLRSLVDAIDARRDALVGGPTINELTHDPYASANQLLTEYLHAYFNGRGEATRDGTFLTSSNMAADRAHFLSSRGFDVRFQHAAGEDRELCERWLARGDPVRFVPDATVHHAHPMTLGAFLRKHFTYGRAAHVNRATRGSTGSVAPPLVTVPFYAGMMRHAFASPAGGVRAAALVALAQSAYATGWIRERSAPVRSGM